MEYPEPFCLPLVEGPYAENGDLRQLKGIDGLVVRVEPDDASKDHNGHANALRQFEEISGLNVVPFSDVIGESEPPQYLVGVSYSTNSRFRAVFHVAKKVTSEIVGHNTSELDFPPDVAASLIEGLTDYCLTVYENKLPYCYEIRPCQFMYGKVADDETPKLYMVDIDYALSDGASVDDLMYDLGLNADFLRDYQPHPMLRPVAERMLAYIRRNEDIAHWRTKSSANKDTYDSIEIDLLDYIDAVEHNIG